MPEINQLTKPSSFCKDTEIEFVGSNKISDLDIVRILMQWKKKPTEELKLDLPYIHKYIDDFEGNDRHLSIEGEEFLEKHKDLVEQVSLELDLFEKKQILLPSDGKLVSEFSKEVGNYFFGHKILFFRPADKCVVRLEKSSVDNIGKKILSFHEVKKEDFVTFIERFFVPCVEKKVYEDGEVIDTEMKPKSMKTDISAVTLVSSQFTGSLPMITNIFNVPMPFLIDGQLVFPQKGYDCKLRSWMPQDAPEIDTTVTLEKAVCAIKDIFSEFCFKSEQDRTNAIAGFITPFLRGLYPRMTCRTPIFFYKANRERAGKDYCAGLAGILYEGVVSDESPLTDDEEFRKRTLSIFKLGKNRRHLANNKGYLNSAQLEMFSTSENWTDRQLGASVSLTFPNTHEISLSANTGITYTPDLANRSIFINLFLDIEDPNRRQFTRPDLHGYVKEHRSELLSCIYALVREWHSKGMPSGKTPFTSFPEWARVCGGIMEVAGLGDPCLSNDDNASIGGDTETRDMKRLFELSYEKWTDMWIEKKVIMDEIEMPDSDFSDLFSWLDWGNNSRSARTKFSLMLRKFVGREMSGIKIIEQDNRQASRIKYMFRKTANVDNVDNVQQPRHYAGDGNIYNICGGEKDSEVSNVSTHDSDKHEEEF